ARRRHPRLRHARRALEPDDGPAPRCAEPARALREAVEHRAPRRRRRPRGRQPPGGDRDICRGAAATRWRCRGHGWSHARGGARRSHRPQPPRLRTAAGGSARPRRSRQDRARGLPIAQGSGRLSQRQRRYGSGGAGGGDHGTRACARATLVNLLLNAVDATPPGGSIVIGSRRWAYEPGQSLPKRAGDLVVDDELGLRQSLGLLLTDVGYTVTAEQDGKRGLERAVAEAFDLVLCDVRMPEMDGLTFLRSYRQRGGNALVIVMSAYGGEDAAIAAMKEGAYDYLPKPFRPDEVVLTLRKAEERERLRQEVAGLRAQLASGPAERGLIAESAAMRRALTLVARVAEHNTTVLITGESGTGKEVIARAIHRASPRASKAFVGINCAAIPETLLESELFGHVRGAFTGATGDKAGLFEQASGGTLLLDEIGELPIGLQAKLLRVLQESEIRRVGDEKTRRVDARVLVATARDLEAEVRAGRFRE